MTEKVSSEFVALGVFNASFGLAQIEGALERGETYDAGKLLIELTQLGETIRRCGAIAVNQLEKDAEKRVDEKLRNRGRRKGR